MAFTIVRVASGGIPAVESDTGFPYYEADNGYGIPVTFGDSGIPLGSVGGPVLNLSASSISDGASVGDTVGTLSVTNGTGSYTYSITSDPSSQFSISGDALQVATSLAAGSYPVSIEADNGSGSVVTRSFLITVTTAGANTGQPMGLLLSITYA